MEQKKRAAPKKNKMLEKNEDIHTPSAWQPKKGASKASAPKK